MDRPDSGPRSPARVRRRLAICLWLALGFVVWNEVFDSVIVDAGRDYLNRKALARQGLVSDVTVFGTMRPASARGVIIASLWSLPVVLFGLSAVWFADRRDEQARAAREMSPQGTAGPEPPSDG